MKKLVLKLEEEISDYYLIGIVTHEKDYRLSWLINKQLEFNFSRMENLDVIDKKTKTTMSYSVFEFNVEDDIINLKLIKNKCLQNALIPSYKEVDYLLMVSYDSKQQIKNQLILALKKIKNILMVFEISMEKIDTVYQNRLLF